MIEINVLERLGGKNKISNKSLIVKQNEFYIFLFCNIDEIKY